MIENCATFRLKWLERLPVESLLVLCVSGALRLLRCYSSMRLILGLITKKSQSLVHERQTLRYSARQGWSVFL
jgi:hypothetical protein